MSDVTRHDLTGCAYQGTTHGGIQKELEACWQEIARLQALVDEMSEYDRRIKAEGIREMLYGCRQFSYNYKTKEYDLPTGKIDVEDAEDWADKLEKGDELR